MTSTSSATDDLAVRTLRCLSMDMVQAANSGHPGLPLGAAPMAYTLFSRHLSFDPTEPEWLNRDRFVLSAGHGSALLYALLHTFGYDLPMDELKKFRQWGSKTPGHPEFGLTPGVEATTGPLGQGFANGVGMAIAEEYLAQTYNRPGHEIINHTTFGIVSDGDLMEGVALEACSLAGHLGLGKLIYLYDNNSISLDGPTALSYTDDVSAKFTACGWHTTVVADGNNLQSIDAAIAGARAVTDKPSLVLVTTQIGFGSPIAGKKIAHSFPWPEGAVSATKLALGAPSENFVVPAEVALLAGMAQREGTTVRKAWNVKFEAYRAEYPELAAQLDVFSSKKLPTGWETGLDALDFGGKPLASRDSGKIALNAVASHLPWLAGGAADLSSSTKTTIDGSGPFEPATPGGRNVYFGVREHAMGSVMNGMSYSGLVPFGSTFLVFSDYMRGAIRLASISHLPSIFVFTHDSVFVGEDGPTHEPIEQVMSLRTVPNLRVYRPADAWETTEAWRAAVGRQEPCVLVLTRQALPTLDSHKDLIKQQFQKGAYCLQECEKDQVALLATGSEVHLALESAAKLAELGVTARVVSMPCWELFAQQSQQYQDQVLPPNMPKVGIEAGVTVGWGRWIGTTGKAIGIDRFGESAAGERVYAELGMTVDAVVAAARSLVK